MDKNIRQFCERYDLEIHNNCAHGQISGYEVNVFSKRSIPFVLQINYYASEQQRVNINNEINEKGIKYIKATPTQFGIEIGLTNISIFKTNDRIDNVIETIFQVIKEYNALGLGYCPVTGLELNTENIILCDIGLTKVTISQEARGLLNIDINEEKISYDNTPKNYLRGFIGILIGAISGSFIYIFLSIFGIFSAWTSLIAMIGGTFFYKRFGGRPDKIMILMSSLTTFTIFILALMFTQIIIANALVRVEDLGIRGINALKFCLETDSKFTADFYSSLMLTIVFTIFGIGIEVFSLFRSIKK